MCLISLEFSTSLYEEATVITITDDIQRLFTPYSLLQQNGKCMYLSTSNLKEYLWIY